MGNTNSTQGRTEALLQQLRNDNRRPTIALIGDVGHGKSSAINSIHRIVSGEIDGTPSPAGKGSGRTTCFVRKHDICFGDGHPAVTLIDFPGFPIDVQLNTQFIAAVAKGVKNNTGDTNIDVAAKQIMDPTNRDTSMAPDIFVFVINPQSIETDRFIITKWLLGGTVDAARVNQGTALPQCVDAATVCGKVNCSLFSCLQYAVRSQKC